MTTPTLLPREAWTTRDPKVPLTRMTASRVVGTCVHWPGTTARIGDIGRARTASRLEGYRRFHTAAPPIGKGWNDIAYQVGVDQGGRAWSLRGVEFESAANGTTDLNDRYVALLLLLGPGETPSPAMLDTARWVRSEVILDRYPGAELVVPHSKVRPSGTECPGDEVREAIVEGELSRPWTSSTDPAPEYVFTLRRYLMVGTDGRDVEQWQRRCNALVAGTARDTKVDGDFGEDTERITRLVQRQLKVADDGIVGPVTAERARVRWAGPR